MKKKQRLKQLKRKAEKWKATAKAQEGELLNYFHPPPLTFNGQGDMRNLAQPRPGVQFAGSALAWLYHHKVSEFETNVLAYAEHNHHAATLWGAFKRLLQDSLRVVEPSQILRAAELQDDEEIDPDMIRRIVWGADEVPPEWAAEMAKAVEYSKTIKEAQKEARSASNLRPSEVLGEVTGEAASHAVKAALGQLDAMSDDSREAREAAKYS